MTLRIADGTPTNKQSSIDQRGSILSSVGSESKGICQRVSTDTNKMSGHISAMANRFDHPKPPTPPRPSMIKASPKHRPAPPPLDVMDPPKGPGPQDNPAMLSLDLPIKEQTTQLARLVSEATLPQCVRLDTDYVVPGCSTRLNKGDVLLLHFVYDNPTVHATTAGGKNLRLPIYAEQTYEILPLDPRLDDKEYNGTEELINADIMPATVRVVEAHCSCHPDESQEVDDIIDIKGVEHDRDRGRLLVGICGKSQIKYPVEMNACRYTTMVSPDFHRMAELKDRRYPQRVRIPNPKKSFSERNFEEEKVMHLNKFSNDKCIVATRAGDSHIYSIPITAPIHFKRDTVIGSGEGTGEKKHPDLKALLPALYPLVNPTWGLVDPTQEALSTLMEPIPQPNKNVLDAWLQSEEGKTKACEVTDHKLVDFKEEMTEAHKEMRRMKVDLDFFKSDSSPLKSPSNLPTPSRPPRSRAPEKTSKPSEAAPQLPPRPPGTMRNSESQLEPDSSGYFDSVASDISEYEDVNELLAMPTPGGYSKEVTAAINGILAKKEVQLTEARRLVRFWQHKCETLDKENKELKKKAPSAPGFYEELPPARPFFSAKNNIMVADDSDDDDYHDYLEPLPAKPSMSLARAQSTRSLPLPPSLSIPTAAAVIQAEPKEHPLTGLSVGGVGTFLQRHGLSQYVEGFMRNDVDGALLVVLEEDHMIDLNMSRLHALKLKVEIDKLQSVRSTLL